jgi:hypothetical protein
MRQSTHQQPGMAREERWCVQCPEYLFDAFFMKPRDGKEHLLQWGFHNVGEMTLVTPGAIELKPAKNKDGSPWDPFGYYRKNTGHEGMSFATDSIWQADWTILQGGLWDGASIPKGARMRVTQAGEGGTEVVWAWLTGPRRQDDAGVRQDFVVARRNGRETCFVSTCEPVAASAEPFVRSVEVVAKGDSGARVVKVSVTGDGEDYFLVGGLADFTEDLTARRPEISLGPFTTDAALAVVRVRGGRPVRAMLAGGQRLKFKGNDMRSADLIQQRAG